MKKIVAKKTEQTDYNGIFGITTDDDLCVLRKICEGSSHYWQFWYVDLFTPAAIIHYTPDRAIQDFDGVIYKARTEDSIKLAVEYLSTRPMVSTFLEKPTMFDVLEELPKTDEITVDELSDDLSLVFLIKDNEIYSMYPKYLHPNTGIDICAVNIYTLNPRVLNFGDSSNWREEIKATLDIYDFYLLDNKEELCKLIKKVEK